MNSITEETALPTTTSDPDVEPIFVEGKPLSPRLDRQEYEYEDEPSTIDHVLDSGQSMRSERTLDDDETMSIARTFGVRSRASNSLRQHSSIDSPLRQKVPIPASPNHLETTLPPTLPPKSPNRLTFDDLNSQAGPSSRPRPVSLYLSGSGAGGRSILERTESRDAESTRYVGTFNAGPRSVDGSDTPRSTTPASSFYAQPRRERKQPGPVGRRGSSLLDLNALVDDSSTPPRSDRLPRSSDEGFDTQSNSTGSRSHSLRSRVSIPVDANLRSMPGVVGLGEGWAGGPQGQEKKRRLWFKRKSSKPQKVEEDPLALWSIQENGLEISGNGKGGTKKGLLKDAWNRSIGKFGSMPALVSGDQLNGSNGRATGVKALFSRSKLDLVEEDKNRKRPVDPQAQEKKDKRRTVAFFGTSKSQVELTTPRARPTSVMVSTNTNLSPSPPSPSPAPRALSSNGQASQADFTFVSPIKIPDHTRRSSGPISTPASPGGLPPPWRPSSFIIPRPNDSRAPRPFSRHEDLVISEEPGELEIIDDQAAPSLHTGDGLQNSISSAGIETPRTNSAEGRSLKHKRSAKFSSDDAGLETPTLLRPKSSLVRSTTPYTLTPINDSTPGLDTLNDWANEGKRPLSRAFRPAQDAPPKLPDPPKNRSQTPTWAPVSFMDRIRQAFTPSSSTETPRRSATPSVLGKELPDLPHRSSTPVMPGAFPDSRSGTPGAMSAIKDDPLPPSPYDITEAVARQMMSTPSPSRPTSRAESRKRGLSGDLWSKRLTLGRISERNDDGDGNYTRPTSRLEKRGSYAMLAGRLGFGSRRNSSGAEQSLTSTTSRIDATDMGVSPFVPTSEVITPLTVSDFGDNDLGLDDILDENRRMTLVRDLEAALPLPPAREEPVSPITIASSPKTISSSEATILARSPIDEQETEQDRTPGHRNHPSTSTAATFDLDELMTPADIRKSFERTVEARRGSQQSDSISLDSAGNIAEQSATNTTMNARQHWPTRKHTRNTSMGSIGELASTLLNDKSRSIVKLQIPQDPSVGKRGSIIVDEDEDENRIREREERTMSFASHVSDLSSAVSFDDEEAVPMSAVRVASVQQVKLRQMELGPEIRV